MQRSDAITIRCVGDDPALRSTGAIPLLAGGYYPRCGSGIVAGFNSGGDAEPHTVRPATKRQRSGAAKVDGNMHKNIPGNLAAR